jgi:dTDP-4-dehydrorhamnose 3,5-epimerase
MTLQDHTEVMYHVSQFYEPAAERGIRWDDPAFGIVWPAMPHITLSPKDRSWPDFEEK